MVYFSKQLLKIYAVLLVIVLVGLALHLYRPVGRFQPVGTSNFAVDTKTGELCSTLDPQGLAAKDKIRPCISVK